MNAATLPTGTIDLTRGVRRAAIALVLLGALGLPATYVLAAKVFGSAGGPGDALPQVWPATIAGIWVWLVALLGLAPLWLARRSPPTHQVNARLGHVMLRLLLTAGGLVVLLLVLPENDRLAVGLFGIGWYVLTWVIDFSLLRTRPAQAAS